MPAEIEEEVAGIIARLSHRGLKLHVEDEQIRISGPQAAFRFLGAKDRETLSINRALAIELLRSTSPADKGGESSGRRLTQHLRDFWKDIQAGNHDEGFTNRTHRVLRWSDRLDARLLREAAQHVVRSHPVLGTAIYQGPDGEPYVNLEPDTGVHFISRQVAEGVEEESIRSLAHELVWHPMRLQDSFHRFFAIAGKRDYIVIGLVLHHLIADRHSVGKIFADWLAQANSIARSGEPLKIEPERAFLAFLTDQRDRRTHPDFARHRQYWRKVTAETVEPSLGPIPDAPPDQHETGLEAEDGAVERLQRIALREGVSLLSLLLAAHARAQVEVLGGPPSSVLLLDGRPARSSDRRIGNYNEIKTLNVPPRDGLIGLAKAIHSERLAGLSHGGLPYDLFGDLYYPEVSPQLPLVNFVDNSSISRRMESQPDRDGGPFSVFDTGSPPAVKAKDREFEAYYLHLHAGSSRLKGYIRASSRLLPESSAQALIRAMDGQLRQAQ